MNPNIAYIGLGSNLSNPVNQINTAYGAMNLIASCSCIALSPLYKSKAIGPEQPDYINAVAKLETDLSPLELLDTLQAIENQQKRIRKQHWGPRTIDLDILLYGNDNYNSTRLTIPHPFMSQRNFVLAPLFDIEPMLTTPNGTSIKSLLDACGLDNLHLLNRAQQ